MIKESQWFERLRRLEEKKRLYRTGELHTRALDGQVHFRKWALPG